MCAPGPILGHGTSCETCHVQVFYVSPHDPPLALVTKFRALVAETIPAINEVDVEGGGSSFGRPSALSAALGTSLGTSPADARRRTYN